jgi:acyl-CoA dehydrogenase
LAGTLIEILDREMLKNLADHEEIRDVLRALCAQFPDEYHRRIDEQRAYPEAFVDASTKAGWLPRSF